jgi:hypothetical protein
MQADFNRYNWNPLTVPMLKQALDLANVHPANRSRMRKQELIDLLIQTYNQQPPTQVTPGVAAILQQAGYPGRFTIHQGPVPATISEGVLRRSRAAPTQPQTPPPAAPPQQPPPAPGRRAPAGRRRPPTAAVPPAPQAPPQAPPSRAQPSPPRAQPAAQPSQPSPPRAQPSPPRAQQPRPHSPPRISRRQLTNPPCQFVPSGPCSEGFSFIEAGTVNAEDIPANQRVFLQVGNRTICLDAAELQDYFETAPSAQRNLLDTGYGTCQYTPEQQAAISRLAPPPPPCEIVPTGPCSEGFSFTDAAVAPESIPENRRIFLKVGNQTVCLDAQELENYFQRSPSARRNVLRTGYGNCSYTQEQRQAIDRVIHPPAPPRASAPSGLGAPGAPGAPALAPLPILRPVQPAPAAGAGAGAGATGPARQIPTIPVVPPPSQIPQPAPPAQAPALPETLPEVRPINVPASLQRGAPAQRGRSPTRAAVPAAPAAPAAASSRRSRSPARRSRSPVRTAPSTRTMRPEELQQLSPQDLSDLIERAREELYRRTQGRT